MKPKIAIACQGGGSQTAFTAGVLKALFDNKVQNYFDIVSISGTSGGAICAFFIWYSLKNGDKIIWKRLIDFWNDNTAQNPQEKLFNDSLIKTLELFSKGIIPQYNLSPNSQFSKNFFSASTNGMRKRFTDLAELLKTHFDFTEIEKWGAVKEPPVLLIGACNILTGKMRQFNSYKEPIKIEHLMASACIPSIFPAVTIETMAYWDGLFSDNPPVSSLIRSDFVGIENIPDEIWVIKINPTARETIPVDSGDIADRRNELEGNVSLFQSLDQIDFINQLYIKGALTEKFLKEIQMTEPFKIPKSFSEDPDHDYHIPMIEMSDNISKSLNYESKLDRSPELINLLISDGELQGKKFLEKRLKQIGVS